MPNPKLVLIAIDAADSSLVREWASQGYLPTFASLLESGVVIPVATPIAVLEGGIWPTLLTSSSPAAHGMCSFQAVKPGSYDVELGMCADRLPTPPFWSHMSRAGKRVAVIDAPFARPLDGLNGVQITNWGAHDAWCWPRSSSPSAVIKDVVKRFGEHPVPYCDAPNRSLADYEALRAGLLAGVERKTTLLRHFLSQENWDFFFGVFAESHCAGHQFWHFMDPSHPRHVVAAPPRLRAAIRDVYGAIDAGLGALLKDLAPEVPVLILLSHGMGPFYAGAHLLESVLERMGLNGSPESPNVPGRDSYAIGGVRGLTWNLRRLVPARMRQAIKSWLPGPMAGLWSLAHPAPNLWKPGMRAFVLPSNNMTGAIRINLKGREPFGMVAPGDEYENLCEELTTRLQELENPDTGRSAVQWVRRARELYQGARLQDMPDLFVEWDHSAPISALRSARIGTVTGSLEADRTGDHRQQGLLLGRGLPLGSAQSSSMRTRTWPRPCWTFSEFRSRAITKGKASSAACSRLVRGLLRRPTTADRTARQLKGHETGSEHHEDPAGCVEIDDQPADQAEGSHQPQNSHESYLQQDPCLALAVPRMRVFRALGRDSASPPQHSGEMCDSPFTEVEIAYRMWRTPGTTHINRDVEYR